jgi:hypothetical protein
MKRGKFVTRQKFILAEKITGEKQQTVIDKNGEEFIGLPGD